MLRTNNDTSGWILMVIYVTVILHRAQKYCPTCLVTMFAMKLDHNLLVVQITVVLVFVFEEEDRIVVK